MYRISIIFDTVKPKKIQQSDGNSEDQKINSTQTEKKDWNKFKKEKKELRKARKATKCNFDQMHEAKQIYEKLKW